MGFWSTVLVALRFRADRLPVVTAPLHTYRIRLNAVVEPRIRVEVVTVHRMRNDVEPVHRVRLEAR